MHKQTYPRSESTKHYSNATYIVIKERYSIHYSSDSNVELDSFRKHTCANFNNTVRSKAD